MKKINIIDNLPESVSMKIGRIANTNKLWWEGRIQA
ncbi:unnamed protein product, partial [marine sediment metagenome]